MLADTFPRQRTWPTLAWTGAGALAVVAAQVLGVVLCMLAWRLAGAGFSQIHGRIGPMGPALLGSVVVLSAAWTTLFFWGLTRLRTPEVGHYLALRWPSARQAGLGLAAFTVFMIGQGLLARWLETSRDTKFMLDLVSSVHAMPLVIGAFVIAAPISEELAFRGFLYRTLELKFGGVAAIVLTALGWAALHIQYSLTAISVVFAGGLLFGAIRRYSGSLYLTMLMHALWNGAAVAGVLLMTTKG